MTDDRSKPDDGQPIPALFATIHFRSDERPDGYTDQEIADLNETLRAKNLTTKPVDDDPA